MLIEHVFLPFLKPSLSHIARYAPSLRLQKRLKIHTKIGQFILLPLLNAQFSSFSSIQVLPLRMNVSEHPIPPDWLQIIKTRRWLLV